jgi:3-hydroxy-9,10-secoandrosta-1,3,5(10)-triene-9,17-dione monooxygenase reductase component
VSAAPSPPAALGAAALRAAMGHFATGVTVITAPGAPPRGSTVNAITSVSLDPPLLLVCLKDTSRTLAALLAAGHFGVNVLREDQQDLAHRFARRHPTPFDGVGHAAGAATGAAVLHDALATFECAVHDVADGGDHRIVVGRVLSVDHPEPHAAPPPLLFYRGAFTALGR